MTVKFRNWKPEAVKRMVKDQLLINGEDVGSYVERDARRRLLAIRDPEKWEEYRREIVGKLLMYTVEEKTNSVEITVGVAVGYGSNLRGFYIETGGWRLPAHPYLRPAVFENGRVIVRLLEGR